MTENNPQSWKISKYVSKVVLPHVETLLLYAGIDGRLIEVPREFREAAEQILADPGNISPKADDELVRLFVDHGVLVPRDFLETEFVLNRGAAARSRLSNRLSLTLCPTINCNFRCTYCYQHHIPTVMTESVQDKVIEWVAERNPTPESIFVTWFGGEPLLGMAAIERLSGKLRRLVPEGNYRASMITNGSMLKPDTSEQLADLDVKQIQVTLDGPSWIHDHRRPLVGGKSTFRKIVDNLRRADPRLSINVRVNVDKHNADLLVPTLFDELDDAGLKGRVSVYFAPVVAYTDVCADTAGSCIAGQEWSSFQAQLTFNAYLRGYTQPSLPRSKTNYCIADNDNGWVVNPTGLVFKCWNDVTHPEKAVLNLMTRHQTNEMAREMRRWKSWNPGKFGECAGCKTLPQCMSGCPHITMSKDHEVTKGACDEFKGNLPETVAMYYLASKQQQFVDKLQNVVALSSTGNDIAEPDEAPQAERS